MVNVALTRFGSDQTIARFEMLPNPNLPELVQAWEARLAQQYDDPEDTLDSEYDAHYFDDYPDPPYVLPRETVTGLFDDPMFEAPDE